MSEIRVDFKSFPGVVDTVRQIAFTRTDLAHAAIAVGRNWRRRGISVSERSDNLARVQEIKSIIDYSRGNNIHVNAFYRGLGTTMRGVKSFILGNTICALIAEKDLRIPWLVDLESLTHHYNVIYRRGTKRADFIGRTVKQEIAIPRFKIGKVRGNVLRGHGGPATGPEPGAAGL